MRELRTCSHCNGLGYTDEPDLRTVADECWALFSENEHQFIPAIKEYRARTNASLFDAKLAIEAARDRAGD